MRRFVIYGLVFSFVASPLPADEKKPAGEGKKKESPVTLSGVFEAVQSTELKVATEELTSFKIAKIVAHGTRVKKGQTLVAFDTEDIDKKIKDAEIALRLAKLDMDDAEFAHQQFLKTQELDRAAAERTRTAARQAYDNYTRVDRDRSIATAEYNLKSYQASFNNAAEELKQLEQMYKEDELTEESEEIVLKRAQQSVDSAKFRLEGAKIDHKRRLEQAIPRQAAEANATFTRAEMAFQKTIRSLNTARQKRDIEIRKKRDAFAEQSKKLASMKAERTKLTITAPHDGIAFHGALTRGKLSDKPSTLKKETSVSNTQVLTTVANPAKVRIRAELSETLLRQVQRGQRGTATPETVADRELQVQVTKAESIPFANKKFDCVVAIRKGSIDNIVPGTGCVIKLTKPAKKD